jgi:peptidoglycan/xylan/chitin deacetylase (PgdA/CDA1 family)
VIDAERLICGLSDSTTLPHRAILITFDDAYQSLCRTAAPLLQDNAYPAIVFVPTAYIGGYNAFEPEGYAPREDICSVDDLRDLQRAGLSIQSHAVSHRKLSELTSEEYEDEFERSRSALEMLIGEPVRLLAYPYGDPGRDTRATAAALAQRGYEGAFLYGGDVLHMDEPVSRFALDRIAMGPDTQLREILLRAEGVESAGFYP